MHRYHQGVQNLQVGLGCVRSLVLRRVAVGLSDSSSWRASLASARVSTSGDWEIIGLLSSSLASSRSMGDCAGIENLLESSFALFRAVSILTLVSSREVCHDSSSCAELVEGIARV